MSTTIELEHVGVTLPDLIEKAVTAGDRVILCRGGDPVAVLISPAEFTEFENRKGLEPQGLAGFVGKWEGFEEIEPFIAEAFRARQDDCLRPLDLEE